MIKMIISIIFIIWIMVQHELVHYYVAKYFKCDAKILIVKNKKVKSKLLRMINMGLPFPAVKIDNIRTYRQLNWIMIAPIPFGIANAFLLLVFMTANPKITSDLVLGWLLMCFDAAFIFALFFSLGDFMILHTQHKIRRNTRDWFINNI